MMFLEDYHRFSQRESVSTCELWHFAVIQLVPPRPSVASSTLYVPYIQISYWSYQLGIVNPPEQSTATPRSEAGALPARRNRQLHPRQRPRSPGQRLRGNLG